MHPKHVGVWVIGPDQIDCASQTDVGVRRSHNQDAHVVLPASDSELWYERGHIFLVADGMGAHAVGELASKIAVDNIPHIYSKYAQEGPINALRKAFIEANVAINTRGQQNKEFHGMGTTASALVVRPDGAWIGHVGDSRVYRVRQGLVEQLSFDHSLLWEMAKRQHKNPEELRGIPPNVIVRSLGPEPLVQVDVEGPHPLQEGDTFVLCSDGLSGQVSDREIGAVVTALPPSEAARFLIHLANLQGGPDNITVIVAHLPGEAHTPTEDSQADVLFSSAPDIARHDWRARLSAFGRRVPWGISSMLLGILLGAGAVALTYYHYTAAFPLFFLAGLALLGGLVHLMVQSIRETRQAEQAASNKLHVYRQTAATIDEPLLQRLAEATQALENQVRDKGWGFDKDMYHVHLAKVRAMQQRDRLLDAFREQCRAMLVLMETVHGQRSRGEAFKPLWDAPSSAI